MKQKIIKYLLLGLLTVFWIIIIGYCSFDPIFSSKATILLICIVVVGYGIFLQFFFPQVNTKRLYIEGGLGIILQFLVPFFVFGISELLFPTTLVFLGYTFSFLFYKNKKLFLPLWLGIAAVYAFYFYPLLYVHQPLNEEADFKTEINVKEYLFVNNDLDTVQLSDNGLILIETWNEHCGSCIQAMRDLPSFFAKMEKEHEFKNLYLYTASIRTKNLDKIFEFDYLQNKKQKVLIDILNLFYQDSEMQGVPYFLLFDSSTGELVDFFSGYNQKYKDAYVNRLQEMIEEHS